MSFERGIDLNTSFDDVDGCQNDMMSDKVGSRY